MIDQKEGDFEASSSKNKQLKPPSIPTPPTWSRFKDPRVVRVSQALGGKDRHSKVCTVRGLRDRRVRLSVPTAIQLYDLQERLGLNQPSKVVDWLLNAAKNEIDELPPLQIPQGMFAFGNNQNLDQPMLNFQEFRSGTSQLHDKQGLKIDDRRDEDWGRNDQEERHAQFHHHLEEEDASSSSYTSIFKPDAPNLLTLSQAPRVGHGSGQHEDWHGFGLLPFQPTLSVYHHQPAAASGIMSTQSYLPLNGDLDQKQVSFQRSQLATSSFGLDVDPGSQPVRQIHFNMTANLLPLQENEEDNEA